MKPSSATTVTSTNVRQELLKIPKALAETLVKGRPEFEALIRRTRWGEGPLYVVGCGASAITGMAAACAFESAPGWPVISRSSADFRSYSLSVLRPRSVLLAISHSGESQETLEVARAARARGAAVLALTGNPSSALAKTADGAFRVRAGNEYGIGITAPVCQQAALGLISVLSAHLLKRPDPHVEELLEEFEGLPQQAEWILSQLHDAAHSFAADLKGSKPVRLGGFGFFRPVALQSRLLLARLGQVQAEVLRTDDLFPSSPHLEVNGTLILLSGSRCRMKKHIHDFARRSRSGCQTLSITDSSDRELVDASSLAVLLPAASEVVASTAALIFLAAVACETVKR
jgi:fructoselysine-6-P-deglycase FrlB-like protein